MNSKQLLLIAPLLAFTSAASAALYVTDNITVGIFSTPDLQGEPESRLSSGTAVDVIEKRGNLLKVKTEHGEQGWLRSSFLTKREPAALHLEEVKQDLAQLESTVETLRDENEELKKLSAEAKGAAALRGELDKLRKQNETLTAQLAVQPKSAAGSAPASVDDQVSALQAQFDAVQNEKSNLEQRLAAAVLIDGGTAADFDGTRQPSLMDIEVKLPGIVVVLIAGLLLGGGLTYRWFDKRLLKRFGGIKFH